MNEIIEHPTHGGFDEDKEEHKDKEYSNTLAKREFRLPKQYQMFMAHIHLDHFEYLEETLNEYEVGEYIIAHEITPRTGIQHFHFLVEMSKQDYARFSKRVFIDKFKLRGRATKGAPRQYGKINDIKDLDRAAAYTIKDGNIKTNMTQDRISALNELAYEKKADDTVEKIISFVDENIKYDPYDDYNELETVGILVIDWLIKNQKPLRQSTIRYYSHQVMAYTRNNALRYNSRQLYKLMFHHGI